MSRRVRHLNPAQCGAQIALDARFITGVADGAALSAWSGRANSSISASQGTGVSQPLYRGSSINGRPAVDFDGSNDFMDLYAGALSLTNGASTGDMISVVIQDASATAATVPFAMFSHGASAAASRFWIVCRSSGVDGMYSVGRRLDGDAPIATVSAGNISNASVAESRARWNNGNHFAAINGVVTIAANYSSGAGTVSATNSLAAQIGGNSALSAYFNGKISAVVVVVPAFSDAVRRRIRQSLGFSYRIATA